jgi:hypothetical protein
VGTHAVAVADAAEASQGTVVGAVGATRVSARAIAIGVVSRAGVGTILVVDAYAVVGVVSRTVRAAGTEVSGNIMAVAGASASMEAGMGATMTRADTAIAAGGTGDYATVSEGDADGGSTNVEGGGDDGGGDNGGGASGDNSNCQGLGSR